MRWGPGDPREPGFGILVDPPDYSKQNSHQMSEHALVEYLAGEKVISNSLKIWHGLLHSVENLQHVIICLESLDKFKQNRAYC